MNDDVKVKQKKKCMENFFMEQCKRGKTYKSSMLMIMIITINRVGAGGKSAWRTCEAAKMKGKKNNIT